jgi:hypothetical protein
VFLWGGVLTVVLLGCDDHVELTEPSPPGMLQETPYSQISGEQYEALQFIDDYIEARISATGKRPPRAAVERLIGEAHVEWLRGKGYSAAEAIQQKEQLLPHLRIGRTVDDGTSFSVQLAAQGFSKVQRRLIGRLIDHGEKASSFVGFRKRLQRTATEALVELGEERAAPILSVAARMEGVGEFLHERQAAFFDRPSLGHVPEIAAGKAAYNPKCARGPKPFYLHFKWRNLVKQMLSGGMTGCTLGGGMAVLTGFGGAIGCGVGSVGFSSVWAYYYWKDVHDAEEEALRSWCDECFFAPESPRNDVGECRRRFGTGEYPTGHPPIPPGDDQTG